MVFNADDSDAKRFHVGVTIAGRYLVERPIGEGAMGAVALARHVSLDERVAIKFLPPELRRDPVANARLSREARALARIKSDHVARVLDVGATLSVGPYMVMEYLEGVDLGDLLEREGPLTVERAVECVLQVCEALTVAHTAGIVHRDIKPQNLFLARHGRFETLKVLDFGIADVVAPGAEPREQAWRGAGASEEGPASGVVLRGGAARRERAVAAVYGTPAYMSPERVRNDPTADHRSDIWSVGVVLHELVTGRNMFDASTIAETCRLVLSEAPIELETNEALLPRSLRLIIARCLERDPERRYPCVEELAAALAPLATMQERFRGRTTGAFSRRLLEEELARSASAGAAPEGGRSAGPLRAVAARVRARLSSSPSLSSLRYAALVAGSAVVAAFGTSLLGGVRWIAPPRPDIAALRTEPGPGTAVAMEPSSGAGSAPALSSSAASGSIASGSIASGSIASGSIASGSDATSTAALDVTVPSTPRRAAPEVALSEVNARSVGATALGEPELGVAGAPSEQAGVSAHGTSLDGASASVESPRAKPRARARRRAERRGLADGAKPRGRRTAATSKPLPAWLEPFRAKRREP